MRGSRQSGGSGFAALRRRPSHATVIAWVALFVSLGGVATALQGRDSVNSGDVKNNTLVSRDIHDQTLRSIDLRDQTLTGADIHSGAIGTSELLGGSVTPAKIGTLPAVRVEDPQEGSPCATQTIGAGTEVVKFSLEDFDTDGLHEVPPAGDCSGDAQSKLTAPIDGIYAVDAEVVWGSSPDGQRVLELLDSGSGQVVASDDRGALNGGGTTQTLTTLQDLAAGQYVQLRATQDSGSSLALLNGQDTFFAMHWVAPLSP